MKKRILLIILLSLFIIISIFMTQQIENTTKEASLVNSNSLTPTESNSIIVYSYAELSSALSEDNGYTYIYIGADIEQSSSTGIAIHSSKEIVVIDGHPPESFTYYTFTQYASIAATSPIRVTSQNTSQVEIKNLNIVGKNYYGFVYVSSTYSNVTLTYNDVQYNGPQLVFNPSGTAEFINTDITLQAVSGGTVTNEAAEAAKVILGGQVTIQATDTANSIFWLKGSATSLTVLEDANVNITTNYYLVYADASNPSVLLKENSSLNYLGNIYGFQYATQTIESLIISNGASLNVTQTKNSYIYGFFRIRSLLQVDENASLYVNKGSGGYAIQFTTSNAKAVFNQPDRVKLYAPSSAIFYFGSGGTLDIKTEALNYWKTTTYDNDTIDEIPTYMWNKNEDTPLTIVSTLSGTNQTALTTNFDIATDPTTTELTTSTFNLGSSQMIVFGQFDLTVDKVTPLNSSISGTTEYNADLLITYQNASGTSKVTGSANETQYSLAITDIPILDEIVTVLSHQNSLKRLIKTIVVEEQDTALEITYVPSIISFGIQEVPTETTLYKRINNDQCYITIVDKRSNSNSWDLFVSIDQPLFATVNNTVIELVDSLVYVENNQETPLTKNLLKIYNSSGSTTIAWNESEGLLLRINPSVVYSNVTYQTSIHWTLQDAP